MIIKVGNLYTSKEDRSLKILVTSAKKDTVLKDFEVEYFPLTYQCFCSRQFFEEAFDSEEAIEECD